MNKIIKLCFTLLAISNTANAQQTSFKFDFGTGAVVPGYIAVTPQTMYTSTTGFGFINAE
jgi:hypothetical protein